MTTPDPQFDPEKFGPRVEAAVPAVSKVDKLTHALHELSKATEIKQLVCVVITKDTVPVVMSSASDVASAYAILVSAEEGMRSALVEQVMS